MFRTLMKKVDNMNTRKVIAERWKLYKRKEMEMLKGKNTVTKMTDEDIF